jgi:hypothetical protein
MNHRFPILLVVLSVTLFNCGTAGKHGRVPGYDLKHPDAEVIMPDTLREISGLTLLDDSTFACIQDENGIVFLYDLVNLRIREQKPFDIDGDYEEITRVGNALFVLRSDGVLFEIPGLQVPETSVIRFETGIPANNNEGMCYDDANGRLLIACKGRIGKGKELKDLRAVYGFDLATKTLTPEPVYVFDVRHIAAFARHHNLKVPEKKRKKNGTTVKEPFIRFRTSAIGIHPVTRQLYLLSAPDHMLFIFNPSGKLVYLERLDPVLFNQAEGISFFDNGDMLITNEGQHNKPTVLRFNYRAK